MLRITGDKQFYYRGVAFHIVRFHRIDSLTYRIDALYPGCGKIIVYTDQESPVFVAKLAMQTAHHLLQRKEAA